MSLRLINGAQPMEGQAMKRMLIFAGLAWAMLFLPACSSPPPSRPSDGLRLESSNWRSDGTYVIEWKSLNSMWEFTLLVAGKTGRLLSLAVDPNPLNELVSRRNCEIIGMTLLSFDVEKDIIVCMGV